MAVPLDVITAFHNAFRRDLTDIDRAALGAARGAAEAEATMGRYRFFNEVLVVHAHGEEQFIFPALEQVAPDVAEAYLKDHRGLDDAFEALDAAVAADDPLSTARATAAFKFHLDVHLYKEDTHLYRLFRERIPEAEQAQAVRMLASVAPPEFFPGLIAWLFPLLTDDDRENLLRVWQMLMPAQVFAGVEGLAHNAVGDEAWAEMSRRIPGLAA